MLGEPYTPNPALANGICPSQALCKPTAFPSLHFETYSNYLNLTSRVFISKCGELILMISKSEHSPLYYNLSSNLHLVLFLVNVIMHFLFFWQSIKQEELPGLCACACASECKPQLDQPLCCHCSSVRGPWRPGGRA